MEFTLVVEFTGLCMFVLDAAKYGYGRIDAECAVR
jgi:hypothetical protein